MGRVRRRLDARCMLTWYAHRFKQVWYDDIVGRVEPEEKAPHSRATQVDGTIVELVAGGWVYLHLLVLVLYSGSQTAIWSHKHIR